MKPRKDKIRKLAEKIAAFLFTNGVGKKAEFLMLTDRKRNKYTGDWNDFGSWSQSAIADQLEKMLRKENASEGS